MWLISAIASHSDYSDISGLGTRGKLLQRCNLNLWYGDVPEPFQSEKFNVIMTFFITSRPHDFHCIPRLIFDQHMAQIWSCQICQTWCMEVTFSAGWCPSGLFDVDNMNSVALHRTLVTEYLEPVPPKTEIILEAFKILPGESMFLGILQYINQFMKGGSWRCQMQRTECIAWRKMDVHWAWM